MSSNSSQLQTQMPDHKDARCGQFAQKLSKIRYMTQMLSELHAMSVTIDNKTLTYFVGMAALEANENLELLSFQDVFKEDEI